MNEHDSERMSGLLEQEGLCAVDTPDAAEVIILNTCSIREKAEQKFYSELGRLTRMRDLSGKKVAIAVAGCIAQQEGRKILARVPSVDMILGPSDIARLPGMIKRSSSTGGPEIATEGDSDYHVSSLPAARSDRIKAWVSIMYGCDNFCTYCVVPYLRGRERSRPSADIVQEVRELAGRGYREVTLLGQNVNSYGKGGAAGDCFPDLLRKLNDVSGIERIRFVTSHPKDLSDDLIQAFRDLPKVCESMHLPVQHGSDKVLMTMNRKYTIAEYRDKVRKLRDAVPDMVLTTDIIVGFPGEHEEDFEQTLHLLGEMRYDNIFAFKYSQRPGTAALKLAGHIPEAVKEDRLDKVFEVQKPITLERNNRHKGTVQEILVEGKSKRGGKLTGRTRGNKIVNVAGPDSLVGSLAKVRITSAGPNSLGGELCE